MPRLMVPPLKLDHLRRLTDSTGIIQHATYGLPELATGYTTDDNARALIAALKAYERTGNGEAVELAERYLAFLAYARNGEGKFRNFADYSRRFVEDVGSEDSCGRAVWACGYVVDAHEELPLARNAGRLLEGALPWTPLLSAPRARSFALAGLYHLVQARPENRRAQDAARLLADSLVRQYRAAAGQGWHWFEEVVTYSNGIMPMALFLAHRITGKKTYLRVASDSLAFLTDCLFQKGVLRLVGNAGWYRRGKEKAAFDEQPEDAGLMVLAYLTALETTGRKEYLRLAEDAFGWFLGRNAHGQALYDPRNGGCYDGLTPAGVNENQGAESLLAYLLSCLSLTENTAVRTDQGRAKKGAAAGGTG